MHKLTPLKIQKKKKNPFKYSYFVCKLPQEMSF